jgi:hypothetical protein
LIPGWTEGVTNTFWIVSPTDKDRGLIAKKVNGIAVRVLQRADVIAMAMRIANWSQIVPYRVCSARFSDRRLQRDILSRLEKPHRMDLLEAAFHPVDVSSVRSALFELRSAARIVSPPI